MRHRARLVTAALACTLAPSLEWLLVGRAVQGMAAGGSMIVSRTIIRDLFDGARAQRLMSRVAVIFGIAPALAPILGGVILQLGPWRVVFGFLGLLGVLLIAITSNWWGLNGDATGQVRATYLLSFLIVFVLMTLITLRLPLLFTVGFVLVDVTFALAFIGVAAGAAGLFPIAGISTFLFCAVFAYILADGMGQDLGAKALPLGNPIVH